MDGYCDWVSEYLDTKMADLRFTVKREGDCFFIVEDNEGVPLFEALYEWSSWKGAYIYIKCRLGEVFVRSIGDSEYKVEHDGHLIIVPAQDFEDIALEIAWLLEPK